MKMVMGQVLRDRYRFDRELGRRGHVVTWLVTDLKSLTPCVLKVLREADALPADARLFEAQARVLAGLDSPGLPRFVEHFVQGEGKEREHCLVTRFHPGESLYRLVGKGRMLSEAQAAALLRRLVPVLAYLHGFQPPLVHRGIKATNIILGPDGRPCLTDLHFAVEGEGWKTWEETPPGAAQIPLAAPEVALGGAVPASDIYAVGLAVIYAMSGRDPAPLAQEGGRQRIREVTRASEPFAAVLARMVEPALERRYPDAQALEAELARLATGRLPIAAQNPPGAKAAAVAPPPTAAPSAGGPAPEPGRARPLRFAVLVVLLLAAVAALWLSTARRGEQTSESLLAPPSAPSAPAPSAPAPVAPPAPSPSASEQPAPPPTPPPTPAAPAAPEATPEKVAGDAGAIVPGATPPAAPAPEPAPAAPTSALAPPAVPAPEAASPVVAEGRLLYDGRPIASVTSLQPSFWFRNQAKGTAEKPQVDIRDGAFSVRGLPRGRMGMSMRINLEPGNPNLYPGDLDSWTTFLVGEGPPPVLEVNLRKVIRLTQPVDNNVVIRGWDEPCGAGSVHPGRVVFSWDPLDPAAQYEVTVDRLACGRNYAAAGRAFATSTAETWVRVELPPSAEGECYSFRLSARKEGRPIGVFTTHGRNGMGWDYRFTVK